MRFPIWLALLAAASVAAVVLFVGSLLLQPERPLIVETAFLLETISPNADGVDDITEFSYTLSENALVSLTFESSDGRVFAFRQNERRAAGDYRVLFSGVVDGYTLPGETIEGDVLRRLIPNGTYTWRFTAVSPDGGETMTETGTLVVQEADVPLPELVEFTVSPDTFTPNQDGVDDRVMVNVFVTKDAILDVYLVDENGQNIVIPRLNALRQEGSAGRQTYDYDGGVTVGNEPPPDGEYVVVAEAQDDEGQVVRREQTLIIEKGGRPLADIIAQPNSPSVIFEVQPYEDRFFSTIGDDDMPVLGDLVAPPSDPDSLNAEPITMRVGDMLVFQLTIENYGAAPLRTSGPPPGTVYQQGQTSASLGETEQSGVWRVGLQCETSVESYPWRWAIGTEDNLYTETDPANGNVYYYLPPGERSVVWGAVRLTDLRETLNPMDCWAGLIHEDVNITTNNANVGRRSIRLAETSTSSTQ
ncbi:MAG: hypothetical protein OHK0046_02510 [Anaerolineae bacterium]